MLLLAALVVLHTVALWGLAQFAQPRERSAGVAPATRIMLLLDVTSAPRAPDVALRVPPPRRDAAASARPAPPDAVRAARATQSPSSVPAASMLDTQGRLRISRHLAQELDAASAAADAVAADAARAGPTFHVPRGDQWLLREPRKVLAYETTVFDEAWMPDDMNPIEEACWRNRALQMLLSSLGSVDCAAPGKDAPRPTPQMIVYGEDDADDIRHTSEDWQRYNPH